MERTTRTAAASPGSTDEPRVRERLHAAAAEVFAQKGYASATVNEIVRKAGVTKPVLYYHFGNKEGIFKAILERALRDFEERLAAVATLKGRAALRLSRLCEEVYAISQRHLEAIRMMHAFYYGPPQAAPYFDFDRALSGFEDGVATIIRQGIDAGEFRGDVSAMTRAVLGVCNECIDLQLVFPERAVGEKGFQKTLDVVLSGMRKGGRR